MHDFESRSRNPSWEKATSAAKLVGACDEAKRWRLENQQPLINHIWIDTCCINQSSSAEQSKSINSMFRWYKRARACLVYLYDYEERPGREFTDSEWFKRGWTLQELVAPSQVEFFDMNWKFIGAKRDLIEPLEERTKIDQGVLRNRYHVELYSVAERMSWFGNRETTVPEDTACCLMGLFDVYMPTIYGEGGANAFRRLQEEIIKYSDDRSIFAWKMPTILLPISQAC